METYDQDEAHCPKHEQKKLTDEQNALRDLSRNHIQSVRAMMPVLAPTDAYIKGSSGQSKGRKKNKKRARHNAGFSIDEWSQPV